MNIWFHLKRPPWRTFVLLLAVLFLMATAYLVWSPGDRVRDGRNDRGQNAMWLQHGWLGDDAWFKRNRRDRSRFESEENVRRLASLLQQHGITTVYPHLCPAQPSGAIAAHDAPRTERFLAACEGIRVTPWVGGVLGIHCFPESASWRRRFIRSITNLLHRHPALAGVQLNIEPMPNGNPHFILLLKELRAAMPVSKQLSVAAYPPPTRWHPFPDVHWDRAYYRQVAEHADQLVPMMYDTSLNAQKVYRYVMAAWTKEVLTWSGDTKVLLGVPVYDDADSGYHHPRVENLSNALWGIHAGLNSFRKLPENFAGVAIYCEWEMDEAEWGVWESEYARSVRR